MVLNVKKSELWQWVQDVQQCCRRHRGVCCVLLGLRPVHLNPVVSIGLLFRSGCVPLH